MVPEAMTWPMTQPHLALLPRPGRLTRPLGPVAQLAEARNLKSLIMSSSTGLFIIF